MYRNILVPVDFDDRNDNREAFEKAKALAGAGAKFTIVHALETLPAYALAEIPDDVLEKCGQEVERSLSRSAKNLPDAQVALISGHAGRAIVDYANENDIDCIVLKSHRPGFSDFFLGSTASNVVRHAKCSVHVIR